ncbi:MAG: acylneuraminate cytidylyltransferase family protein [Candidatus Omnitrophica bacterium]|nr:acylneuraminate cytidylyltransferase family protein [Candidatus Omnitrophota bacterium]
MKTGLLAIIPARGGSKGLPGKNLRPFLGVPLIGHSILFARGCPEVDRCVVSTDSAEIAQTAKRFGAEVPFMRPADLAQDNTPLWEVVRHVLDQVERMESVQYQWIALLDPTSPARERSDLTGALRLLKESPSADGVVGVSRPDFHPVWHSVVEENGWMKGLIEGSERFDRRQDLPPMYRINGSIYLWKAEFVRKESRGWRAFGKHRIYEIPEIRAMSIDTLEEFLKAEVLVRSGLVRFFWLKGMEDRCAQSVS